MISNVRVALSLIIGALATTPATADPLTISVIGAGGVTSFSSSSSQEPQAAPVIFTVSLAQIWTDLTRGAAVQQRHSRQLPDITTEATNQTGVTWTSWGSRRAGARGAAAGARDVLREPGRLFHRECLLARVPEAVFARCNEVSSSSSAGRPKETCSRHITAQSLRAKR